MEFIEGDILDIVKQGVRNYRYILNGDSSNELAIPEMDLKIVEKSLFNKNNLIFEKGEFKENINQITINTIRRKMEMEAVLEKQAVENVDVKGNVLTLAKQKPSNMVISDINWKILVRNVLRAKNTMMIGPTGTGKTSIVYTIAEKLGRPFFKIPLGASQDPRSMLIGNTQFIEGIGTKFIEAEFVKAIQTENAIILLDEFTRINYEAENILFTVLDHQRYLKLDEVGGRIIPVAKGVTFIATANIGNAYTATRIIDRASRDRFITVEMPFLTPTEERDLLLARFPTVKEEDIVTLTRITATVRDDYKKGGEVYGGELISTRMAEDITSAIEDGLTLKECLESFVLPLFENEGGDATPYLSFKALMDRELPSTNSSNGGSARPKNVFKKQ